VLTCQENSTIVRTRELSAVTAAGGRRGLRRLSERSRYLRFHAPIPQLSGPLRRRLTDLDGGTVPRSSPRPSTATGSPRSASSGWPTPEPDLQTWPSPWWTPGSAAASGDGCSTRWPSCSSLGYPAGRAGAAGERGDARAGRRAFRWPSPLRRRRGRYSVSAGAAPQGDPLRTCWPICSTAATDRGVQLTYVCPCQRPSSQSDRARPRRCGRPPRRLLGRRAGPGTADQSEISARRPVRRHRVQPRATSSPSPRP
jgi:hypothetical protein